MLPLPDLQWWAEITVDGLHTTSRSIDWTPGDPVLQDVLLGADLVHGFRPLSEAHLPDEWLDAQRQRRPASTADSEDEQLWPAFNYEGPPPLIRHGLVGTFFSDHFRFPA